MEAENEVLPSAILETCLDVTNLDRSQEFYANLFGYPVLASDDRFCAFNVGGRQVLILFRRGAHPEGTAMPFGRIPPHSSYGEAHVGFSIPAESLRAWEERLVRLGIPVESRFTWPNGGTSVYFRDPDGHLLELLTPGVWEIY